MEIFGNPITGYTTEYYSMLIEKQKEMVDNLNLGEVGLSNEKLYQNSMAQIKYNRMRDKNGN